MLNALRLHQSIDLALFEARTGLHREVLQPALQQAKNKGLLCFDQHQIVMTDLGRLIY